MTKVKNHDRKKQKPRGVAEHGADQAKNPSMELPAEHMQPQDSPMAMAHKGRQKRFGHN
ncbi:hypothetical protein ABIA33_005733 [Streptacidiphilus sp. MAP12-16]|uniref:hypothetical protein n=1 Tax=Streptacidiphilus sp. MAP12-16 TaxID=3156300 RepID=UPI003511DD35